MSALRTLGLLVLATLLTGTAAAGTVVVAGQQTVLDPGFVSDSLEEGGAYERVQSAVRGTVSEQSLNADAAAFDVPVDDMVTKASIERQTEANLDRLYAYLHGDAVELALYIDTAPLKERAVAVAEDYVENQSVSDLLDRVAEGNGSFSLPADTAGVVNASIVASMADDASRYAAAQTAVRDTVRDRVLDAAVEQAWAETSKDEKLGLVVADYDPDEYTEAEKERMVAERETEIRAALRERIERERGDEITATVEDRLAALANGTSAPTDPDANVSAAATALQSAVVHGLAGDHTYEEFLTDARTAKAALATAVGTEVERSFEQEVPARVSLTEDLGSDATTTLQQTRTYVGYVDRATTVLPVLGLALVGLLYLVSRSLVTTTRTAGISLAIAGGPLYGLATYARSNLATWLPQTGDATTRLVTTTANGILATLATDSLTVLATGVVLAAISIALSRGWFAGIQARVR